MKTAIVTTACLVSILSNGSVLAGACTGEIDQMTKAMTTRDAGSGPTSGVTGSAAPQSQQTQAQHPPAAIMSQQTEGKAISPEDVKRQTEGRPTASQQAVGGASGHGRSPADASASLAKAKELDAAGREAECIDAVKAARTAAGL